MTVSILPTGCNKSFPCTKNPQITPREDLEQNNVGRTQQTKQVAEEVWTTECLVDQLFLCLARTKEYTTSKNDGTIPVKKYYIQAHQLMRWIPIARLPSNEFVINISDLTPKVKKEIKSIIRILKPYDMS